MQAGVMAVVIDNDNLLAIDMEPYIDEGVKRGYSVHLIEPNTPWRYSPRKLFRHTSKKISPEQLQTMLDTFDRRLREEELVSAAHRRLNPITFSKTGTPSVSTSVDSPREPDAVVDDSEQHREDEQFLTADEDSTSDSDSSANLEATETNVGGQADESPNNCPQPSCSLPPESVDQLAVVFPRIARARLREYLHLANGNVQWASSLILEGLEVANEINTTRHEENSLSSSDADDEDTTRESVSASHVGADPTRSVCTQAEEMSIRPVTIEVPLAATVYGPNEETATSGPQAREETKGLRISREFIKEAHELYSYSSGLTAVELSPEAVPDFLFHEWSPEPELVRAIYQSFMRYLGVLNGETTVGPRRTAGHIPHSSSFGLPSRRGRGRHSPYVDRGDHFSAIVQQDEALYRSVQDFRSSLDAPVVRRIIDRLLKKVPGIQRSTVEEAFVRNDFSEILTERHLLETYQQLRTSPSKSEKSLESKHTTISGSPSVQNEDLSLKEIQDEEEAVRRSVEDQRSHLQPLAAQLSLCRLKSQFPGIDAKQLETLLIKFDLNEESLVDQLIKDGFTVQPVAPLISTDPQDLGESFSVDTYEETPQLIEEQVGIVRQRIGNIRQRLYHQKDKRISDYYASELNSLHCQLRPLLLKRATILISDRAKEFERQLLQEGDAPAVASSKAAAYIDLHGLDKTCALAVLRQQLTRVEAKLNSSRIPGCCPSSCAIVITGRGGSSSTDLVQTSPVLRPAVINYFHTNGYEFSEKYTTGSGYFTVHLPGKKSKRGNELGTC
ncbi:NEDD4-binding protein 2-like 2 [Clonorchis sinensis]|uniref:NEDD4-binding protein 2-like 2 n=1 Tax=Clonorchis sinensis TaxID=79923 RepID=G7YCU3_CLOSI|nr:NEDD4-binding protein 2-like 2 [Clonorchis sinensis]